MAGPEELEEQGGSMQDGYDSVRRVDIRGGSHSPTRSRRRHSVSSMATRLSPPSTPSSYDSEFSESALNSAGAHNLKFSPLFSNHSMPSIKTEHHQSPRALLYEPSSLHVVPEHAYDQNVIPSQSINQVIGFRLCPHGLDANYHFVDVEALPYPNGPITPTSPTSNLHSQFPVTPSVFTRVSLQFRLYIPEEAGMPKMTGFLGTVYFASPVSSSTTEVFTRVFSNKTLIREESHPLIPANNLPESGFRTDEFKGYPALLPESTLSQCGWVGLGANSKTVITQTIKVDGEVILALMYDISGSPSPGPTPCSQLVRWKKHADPSVYSQANGHKQFTTVQRQLTPPPSAGNQLSHVLPMQYMPYQHQPTPSTIAQSAPGVIPTGSYSAGISSSFPQSPPLLTRSLSCGTASSFGQGTQAPAQPPQYSPIEASSYQLYGHPAGLLLDM